MADRTLSTLTPRAEPSACEWVQRGRVPALDGLRAVSIFLVLIEHTGMARGMGHVGVAMFFTISGFLITMLLMRESDRTGTISLRGFYQRRALRILPAYIALLLVTFALTRIGLFALSRTDWLGALTYTVNFIDKPSWQIGHVWSLSVEEQFYFAWPLLMLLLTPRRAVWAVGGYLVAAPVVRLVIWAFFRSHLEIIDYLTPLRLDTLAAGCLLGVLSSTDQFRSRFAVPRRFTAVVITGAVLSIAGAFLLSRRIAAFDMTMRHSVEAVAMATLIWVFATTARSPIARLLDTPPLVFVGKISYSLYLWQQLFFNPHSARLHALMPLNFVFAFAAAVLSYKLIETPFLRLKDRASRSVPQHRLDGERLPIVQEA